MRRLLLLVVGLVAFSVTQAMADTDDDRRTIGSQTAPVTVIEYMSLDCPHCGHFALEVLPAIRAKYIDSGKVKFIVRDFPLHQPAVFAHELVRCAPPEKFVAFIDALFRTQRSWYSDDNDLVKHVLLRTAKLGGMSEEKFNACMADKAIEELVLQQRFEGGSKYKIDQTPTFIIDGAKIENPGTADAWAAVLDRYVK